MSKDIDEWIDVLAHVIDEAYRPGNRAHHRTTRRSTASPRPT
jgi:hypothetical protein